MTTSIRRAPRGLISGTLTDERAHAIGLGASSTFVACDRKGGAYRTAVRAEQVLARMLIDPSIPDGDRAQLTVYSCEHCGEHHVGKNPIAARARAMMAAEARLRAQRQAAAAQTPAALAVAAYLNTVKVKGIVDLPAFVRAARARVAQHAEAIGALGLDQGAEIVGTVVTDPDWTWTSAHAPEVIHSVRKLAGKKGRQVSVQVTWTRPGGKGLMVIAVVAGPEAPVHPLEGRLEMNPRRPRRYPIHALRRECRR